MNTILGGTGAVPEETQRTNSGWAESVTVNRQRVRPSRFPRSGKKVMDVGAPTALGENLVVSEPKFTVPERSLTVMGLSKFVCEVAPARLNPTNA